MDSAYDLYTRGMRLLEDGDCHAAAVPLQRARDLEPDKTSVREALGRVFFGAHRFREAEQEFEAVVERSPVNHYAQFCLGRSLENTGRRREARRHAALAAGMRPDRADYRELRDRLRAA